MRVNERQFGDATVLDLAGPMVTPQADGMIKAAVRRQVRGGPRLVVINFGGVPSSGSSSQPLPRCNGWAGR